MTNKPNISATASDATHSETHEEKPDPEVREVQLLTFNNNDAGNPVNWSSAKKSFVVLVGVFCIFNSVFGTSLPSGDIDHIASHFKIADSTQLVLPITIYQIGFIIGSLLFGPLSETYGRRFMVIGPLAIFTLFTLASIFAPTWPVFLSFRFIRGACASSAVAVTGGLYADIFGDPRKRGQANALFLCATSVVPNLAPLTSAYASRPPLDWKWPLWIALIIAAVTLVPVLFLPETYGPIILQKRAVALRKEHGPQCNIFAAIELERKSWKETLTIFLARPIRMLFAEWIVLFTCLFLGFATGIYYLFFVAYATVFSGVYGLSEGPSRLMLLPVALGSTIGFVLFFVYDSYLYKAKSLNKPWALNEEYRRLPIACAGGPLCTISLFWLGWTSFRSISLAVPGTSGCIFGLGFYFILMALNNYLADAYRSYSASAMAAVSFARSVGGGFLPLASNAMYDALGVSWATSLLAFVMLVMCIVPFAFIRYGKTIRAHSKFCQQLAQEEEEQRTRAEAFESTTSAGV